MRDGVYPGSLKLEKKEEHNKNAGALPSANVPAHLFLGHSSPTLPSPPPLTPDTRPPLPANKLALSREWGSQCYGDCLRAGICCFKFHEVSHLTGIWLLLFFIPVKLVIGWVNCIASLLDRFPAWLLWEWVGDPDCNPPCVKKFLSPPPLAFGKIPKLTGIVDMII